MRNRGVRRMSVPVALLAVSALERLVAAGRVMPARLDLAELGRPAEHPHEMALSEALAEQRREV